MGARSLFLLANWGLLKEIEQDKDFKRVPVQWDKLISELFQSQISINESKREVITIKDSNEKNIQISPEAVARTDEKIKIAKVLDDTAEEFKKISRDFRR